MRSGSVLYLWSSRSLRGVNMPNVSNEWSMNLLPVQMGKSVHLSLWQQWLWASILQILQRYCMMSQLMYLQKIPIDIAWYWRKLVRFLLYQVSRSPETIGQMETISEFRTNIKPGTNQFEIPICLVFWTPSEYCKGEEAVVLWYCRIYSLICWNEELL